jgi:hypothetical protein
MWLAGGGFLPHIGTSSSAPTRDFGLIIRLGFLLDTLIR